MNSFGFYDVYYSKKRNESYIVQKGDSLYKIAQKYGLTVEEFKAEMLSLNSELEKLNAEAKTLEEKIAENIKGLFNE